MKKILGLGLAVAALAASAQGDAKQAQKVDFKKEIEPILRKSCVECHGPKKQKSKLRLDNKKDAFAWSNKEGGKAIVPGKSKESLAYMLLNEPKDDDRMPQDADPLPKEQIERIKNWIDQGADWPDK